MRNRQCSGYGERFPDSPPSLIWIAQIPEDRSSIGKAYYPRIIAVQERHKVVLLGIVEIVALFQVSMGGGKLPEPGQSNS
jgi:hypothetical protein